MLKEFQEFIARGSVMDLAVGVIIGGAFGLIVTSLTDDIIMPIVGAIFGGFDFSNYFLPLTSGVTASTLAAAREQGAVFAYGNFITVVINFLILAWIILGLIAGVIAKFLMPGTDPGGFFITILIGIAGALIGGAIASALGWGGVNGIDLGSIVVAVLGSILLLFVYRAVRR